jgi:hypothetical protein
MPAAKLAPQAPQGQNPAPAAKPAPQPAKPAKLEPQPPQAQKAPPPEKPAPQALKVTPLERPAPQAQKATPLERPAPQAQKATPAEKPAPQPPVAQLDPVLDFNLPPTRVGDQAPSRGRERRQYRRYDAELDLEVQTAEEMYLFYVRDVSAGGMFICTDLDVPVGASVVIHVRHPQYDEVFLVEAVVRRLSDPDEDLGLGVEFVNLNEEQRQDLMDFIGPAILSERGDEVDEEQGYEDEEQAPIDDGEVVYQESADALDPDNDTTEVPGDVFEPWTGAAERQFWSRPPPDDELDSLFDLLGSHEAAAGAREASMVPSNQVAPDFRLSAPSWDSGDFAEPPSEEVAFELSSIDAIPVEPDEIEARRPAPVAARPQTRASRSA